MASSSSYRQAQCFGGHLEIEVVVKGDLLLVLVHLKNLLYIAQAAIVRPDMIFCRNNE